MADQIAEMKYFQNLLAQHNKALSPNLCFIHSVVWTAKSRIVDCGEQL